MEAATDFVDNHKETEQEDQQSSPVAEKTREELIAEVTETLDNLFDPTALVNNSYLINRVANENFEIPVKTIYMERSVRAKTSDREIIDRALENATNITVNKKGDIITSVMPRFNETKRRIVVRNITKEKLGDFKRFVYSLDTYKEGALTWNFNYQLSMVNIICKDEELAAHVLELLTNNKFEERALECTLENENLYISALEVQKKKFKSFQNPMNQMYNYNAGMYNPYQMYAMYGNQANNFYMPNYYPQMNQQFGGPQMQPYMQPMFNPNPHSAPNMNKKSYNNQNYKNGGDKKFYSKKGKQPRDKNYKFNNSKASTKSSSSIVVNENDFPPL